MSTKLVHDNYEKSIFLELGHIHLWPLVTFMQWPH